MGSIWSEPYKTKKGTKYRIRQEREDGSRITLIKEKFYYARTANEKIKEVSDTLAEGKKLQEKQKVGARFKAYLGWLDDRIRAGDAKMKKSTRRIIQSSFVHILPRLSEKFLHELDAPGLNKFKNELLRDHNVGGVNRILVDLRTFLNWSVSMGDIDKSPMKGVKLFESDFKGYFYSREEMALIHKHARISEAGACGGPVQRLWWAIYVLKESGMRVGEFLNIEWSDLQEHSVRVTGKTGPRIVPLPPVVRHFLVKLLECPWSYSGIETAWRTMILKTKILNPKSLDRETGLPTPPRIHDLRHTFASTYLAKGNSLPDLKKIGGWKTMGSLEKYTHPDIPNLLKTMQKRARR